MNKIQQFLTKRRKQFFLGGKSPLNCMIQEKSTLPNIKSPDIMEVCEVIDKFPDDTSPVVMEDYLKDEHEDRIRNDLVEENDTKENNEVRKISTETEKKDLIHRYITDNETEKIEIPIKR